MILDPKVRVECDEPGCLSDEDIGLTALARGAYDERDVLRELERLGWVIDGDITTCPEHQEDDEAEV